MDNQNNAAHSTANIYNPLIEAAKPVFILVNAMQQTTSQLSTDSLINKFSLLINNFEENAEKMEQDTTLSKLQNTVYVHS